MHALRAAAVAAVVAIAVIASAPPGQGAASAATVVACPGHSFTFAFNPRRGVVVRTGERQLVSASARGWRVSGACRRVSVNQAFADPAEPRFNVYRPFTLACRVSAELRIYLAPIRSGRTENRIGTNVLVAAGDPARAVVGALLTNRPVNPRDRRAPFLYRNPKNCLN